MTRILVIEDEDDVRQNIIETLIYEGFSVIEAHNGGVGVAMAVKHQPDLILCDVRMPELNGYDVLRRLQGDATTSLIPFIFLTAMGDRQSVRLGMDLGASDYLTKPFTVNELLSSIRTRLNKHTSAMTHYRESNPIPVKSATQTHTPSDGSPADPLRWWDGALARGYQIGGRLGEGGVGIVYKAYQPAVGREVAIKVLRQKYAHNSEFLHRFQTEAELIARLEHPHIIPLYDFWHDEDGLYIVMRLLRGGSVRDVLERGDVWSLTRICQLLDQIGGALSVVHRVGIIHRDLKPDNILMDELGNAYLSDFGLAKNLLTAVVEPMSESMLDDLLKNQSDFFRQQPASTLFITNVQKIYGTPAYLAPEQIRFEALSPQTDVYSLGITLYELLVGHYPFDGTVMEIMAKHITHKVPSIHAQNPDVPEAVDAVIRRATAKNPAERYPDMITFARDFRAACSR